MLQDTWEPTPGLEIIGGVRLLDEDLPDFDPAISAWRAVAGLDGGNVDEVRQIAPRIGFRWNIRQEDRWIVRANFGRYDGDIDPALIGERIAFDGGQQMRRAFGSLEYWPSVPDSSVAPLAGPVLAFLGPDFKPPTSTRANFGVSLVGLTSVHLSASYRHTDFLPARRDLNLATGAAARDQYGRAVFGDLVQHGALLGPRPGTNRRFRDFDVVSAIEATAHSEYWEAALQLERRIGEHVRFAGWYVFSQTRDNWLTADAGSLLIAPHLADSAGSAGWADGVSDFDVPHRLGIVAEIALPLPLRPVIGAVYRAQSGVPFTPGYARGVDANGDYFANDPAFVDPLLPGMQEILDEWDCVSEQADQFAERNSCRTEMLHFLDARVGIELRTGLVSARVFVDGMNLLRTEYPDPDAAFVLVDAERSIVRDDASGIISVPLVANPNFGDNQRVVRSPQILRIGAEVSF